MLNVLFAQASDAAESAGGFGALGSIGDVVVFFLFLAAVIFVAFGMSRGSDGNATEYFLAKRSLKWWLIGFSLIAANISAEQFVGMSGQGSDYIGLAVASYEWIAALSLVIVAFFFLPRFLKAGIYTIPEYLEKRYNKAARLIMSIMMMIMLIVVNITVVTYAGAKAYSGFFGDATVCGIRLDLNFFCWVIGVIAACYIFAGGLKACAWADLLQGSALIIAGAVVLYFSMQYLGTADVGVLVQNAGLQDAEIADKLVGADAWQRFNELNASKLRMNLASWDLVIPVTALVLAIWIPNLYYWGLNQYIIQRTLGSKTLGEGQKGLVFAAFMKLLIPFIVIFPGMIAFNLFANQQHDSAQKASESELARFEELKGAPTADQPLFTFSRSFAAYDAEAAQALLNYDAEALGIGVPTVKKQDKMAVPDRLEQQLIAIKKSPEAQGKLFSSTTISGYDTDSALSLLMSNVVPSGGFKGFMLAALLGAIISSVAAMLNAASTIFTMDLYNEFTPKSTDAASEAKRQKRLVRVGRLAVVTFALIGCFVAPIWNDPKYGGVFKAIQEFQGYISPGIFAAFVIGFWMKKAPNIYGVIALLGCPILYKTLAVCCPGLDFLNRMA
ncbi:MAG: sodium/solute symporter, partial [Thermoguttaceae bacterium]|nr:sodium/solute symporter [Thermoguttaceae bacterium]